ncbi:hypothetical protein RUM43_002509 [Polyplax serrata]|uniref:Uncharacterized protein n=1 Tax=Polyplax serrata TaxID=468196 RepID=A0AAN8NTI7_POLSC
MRENQRSSIKTILDNMSRLEQRQDTDHGHLSSLQAQILNLTRWKDWKNDRGASERQEEIQDSRLTALEEKLEEHLEDESTPVTTTTMSPFPEVSKNGHLTNRTSLPELIESLKTVQKEYDSIVHQLPHGEFEILP